MPDLFHQDEPEAPPGAYVEVAVERGIERAGAGGGGALTYRADSPLEIGQGVQVPLGRANKPTQGVVVRTGGPELVRGMAAHKVKGVLKVTGTRLPPRLVELAQWMAGYYICPLGMVLATMVPAAVKRGVGLRKKVYLNKVARLSEPGAESEGAEHEDPARSAGPPALTPAARAVWAAIEQIPDGDFPLTPADLQERTGAKNKGPINRLIEAGLLTKIEREEVGGPFAAWEALRVEQEEGSGQRTVDSGQSEDEACEVAGRGGALPLTEAQRRIVEGIALTLGSFRAHLLRGVTGSGKTEVYLQLIERVVRPVEEGGRGQCALVLVPEISLTPQTAGRFTERFGGPGGPGVAVLHSGLTASQRHKQWEAAATGRAKVIVGARSAIFAPVTDVGLIVVDEEHDDSGYKQDQSPRYHGRDVAVKRAHLEGCPIVLGSATPSLESWHNARAGRYSLWELPERVPGAGVLPKVEIVDLVHERRARQQRALQAARDAGTTPIRDTALHLLGPTLEEALKETILEGGQTILLLNRRGFAHYITCPAAACGWVMNCDDCDATMVLHKGLDVHKRHDGAGPGGVGGRQHRYVRCHHCLAEQLMPDDCPVCGRRLNVFGGGTQRVEEELLRKFEIDLGLIQGETMARVDGDTMRSARDWFDILSRFAKGDLRLLVGTQMIAKGLDFPNVRLVGVVNADTALNMPDFRSAERTFQLVSQVAGRAGRGRHPGRVIVQTLNPKAPAIRLAAVHDYVTFADDELAIRAAGAAGGLPPITKMARIVVRDEEYGKAEQDAGRIAGVLRKELEAEARQREGMTGRRPRFRIEGPAPCPISRIAGKHRIALDVYAEDRTIIQHALGAARAAGHLISDVHTAVDVDPTALL